MAQTITSQNIGWIDCLSFVVGCGIVSSLQSTPEAPSRLHQCREHTKLIVRVGVRRLHGIIIALLVTLHRDMVFQFPASLLGVGVVDGITRHWGGVISLFIVIFSLSFGAVRHFIELVSL